MGAVRSIRPSARLTELGLALGCTTSTKVDPRVVRGRTLPEELYYSGSDLACDPPALTPRDETQAPTRMEREARELRMRARADIIRFVAGRYSARLHRIVRPA